MQGGVRTPARISCTNVRAAWAKTCARMVGILRGQRIADLSALEEIGRHPSDQPEARPGRLDRGRHAKRWGGNKSHLQKELNAR